LIAASGETLRHMAVCRNLIRGQGYGFRAAALPQSKSRPHMDRNPALKIGKGERGLPITPVHRAEEGEKRLVLIDCQQLAARPQQPGRPADQPAERRDRTRRGDVRLQLRGVLVFRTGPQHRGVGQP